MTPVAQQLGSEISVATMITLAASIAIVGICLCRLNSQVGKSLLPRLQYVFLIGASILNILQPFIFKQWPTLAGSLLTVAFLTAMVVDLRLTRWLFPGGCYKHHKPKG